MADTKRRHDIDWLRVIVFGLLIPFHVALGFVPWSVYAYRNEQTAGTLTTLVLIFVHQWRLPVLFLISGMGASFALKNRSWRQFVEERSIRLLLPMLFAMNFVVILGGYFAALARGESSSFLEFAVVWWCGLGEIWHLWFLVNLFVYSLLCAPLFIHLSQRPEGVLITTVKKVYAHPKGAGLLFVVPIPLAVTELLAKPWAYGDMGRGYESPWYLLFFVLGYLCMAAGDTYWQALDRTRYSALAVGVTCSFILLGLLLVGDISSTENGAAMLLNGGWAHTGDATFWLLGVSACFVHSLNSWSWCVVVLAWSARYLNRPSRHLAYLNQAVYPFYIVHLPIVLVVLYYLKDLEMPWLLKFLLITVATMLLSWIVFEGARRTKFTRAVLGIKLRSRTPPLGTTR